jgi:NTP pyrophosphatase (non-canonical NTP hydrolase)
MQDYQEQALRTLSAGFTVGEKGDPARATPEMLHGAIGLATEAGELLDALKRAIYYGAPLDRTNLVEELGDLEWYMAVLRAALGVTQEEVQRRNIAKLRARYPERFTREDALNRDLAKERAILEGRG